MLIGLDTAIKTLANMLRYVRPYVYIYVTSSIIYIEYPRCLSKVIESMMANLAGGYEWVHIEEEYAKKLY